MDFMGPFLKLVGTPEILLRSYSPEDEPINSFLIKSYLFNSRKENNFSSKFPELMKG